MRSIVSKFVELQASFGMCMTLFVIVKLLLLNWHCSDCNIYQSSTLELKIDFYFGIALIAVSLA